MEKKKDKYEKPRIIYQKKIEVLAAVCDSDWTPGENCRLIPPACTKLQF